MHTMVGCYPQVQAKVLPCPSLKRGEWCRFRPRLLRLRRLGRCMELVEVEVLFAEMDRNGWNLELQTQPLFHIHILHITRNSHAKSQDPKRIKEYERISKIVLQCKLEDVKKADA